MRQVLLVYFYKKKKKKAKEENTKAALAQGHTTSKWQSGLPFCLPGPLYYSSSEVTLSLAGILLSQAQSFRTVTRRYGNLWASGH